jgi:uncharacterized protein YggE
MKVKSLLLILVFVLTSCTGQSQDVSSNVSSDEGQRVLSVNGNAQIPVQPDIAYITVGVHSVNEDVAVAVDENNGLIDTVTQKLVDEFGVSKSDIQTSNFNLWASDQYNMEGQHTGVLYTLDSTMYVTVRTLDDLGQILDEVIKNGANSIYGVQFDLADRSSALAEGRTKAVENAQDQAEALAQAAGLTLGEIQSINYYGGGYSTMYYGGIGGGGGGAAAVNAVPIAAGQLMISVDVNITYSISD